MMLRPARAAIVLLLGTQACAAITVQGRTRADALVNLSDGTVVPSAQLAPSVEWHADRSATSATYQPLVFAEARTGGATRVYQRIRLAHTPVRPGGVRPFALVVGEYGRTRATDLPADGDLPIEPRPGVTTLDAYLFRAEGGVRGDASRRTRLSLRAVGERSAGLGQDADVLPAQTRGVVSAGLGHRTSRRDALEANLTMAMTSFDGGSRNLLTSASLGATRALSRTFTAGATGGLAMVHSAEAETPDQGLQARPLVGASVRLARPGGSSSGSLALQLRPEFDRLDRRLRQRLFARASVEQSAGTATTVMLATQWAGDLGQAAAPRRLLAVEGTVRRSRRGGGALEAGARLFLQGNGGAVQRGAGNELRAWVGWTFASARP